jgi:hypothetical protein
VAVLRQLGGFTATIPAAGSPLAACETGPYLAGAAETAVVHAKVNCPIIAGFGVSHAAGVSFDGGQVFPIGLPWTTTNYVNPSAQWLTAAQDQVIALGQGTTYTFASLYSTNGPTAFPSDVACQCSTVVEVVRE